MDIDVAISQCLGRGLNGTDVCKIAALAEIRRFGSGETIVRQFDKNSDVIILLSGAAQIRTFNDELISEIGPGSIVGEISLIDEQPRSATIRSTGMTEVAVIPAEKLRKLMEADQVVSSAVYRNISKTLCSRLRSTTMHLDGLMSRR